MATTNENDKTTSVTVSDMEQFKTTPYYQSLGIEGLQQQVGGYTTDDATLRQQAEAQYKPTYDAEVEALRQQLAQQVQGYEGQLSGMGAAYDRQRRNTNQAYDESAVSLNNALTKRGLGRSSLVSTQGAYLENKRNQALGDIDRDESSAINAINEKVALLKDQAAQSERTMAGSYAQQIESRINELRRQNQSAVTDLQLQIAALQLQGYQAYQQWLLAQREQDLAEREFEYAKSKKSSSSSSASSGSYNYNAAAGAASNTANSDAIMDMLMGGGSNLSSAKSNSLGGGGKSVANNAQRGSISGGTTLSSVGNKLGSLMQKLVK